MSRQRKQAVRPGEMTGARLALFVVCLVLFYGAIFALGAWHAAHWNIPLAPMP